MKASTSKGLRRWTTLLGTAAAAGVAATMGLAAPAMAAEAVTVGAGSDLSGWETVNGGGTFAATGQAPVTSADVAAENRRSFTSLRANINHRGVMADALSYKRITGTAMMSTVHRAGYSFQLPAVPSTAGGARNAQTLEGALFVWDGLSSKRDQGTAFQWVLNPWVPNFGQIRVWSDTGWVPAGYLKPDTAWHSVTFTVDTAAQKAQLVIDGGALNTPYARTVKNGWGSDVSARLQVEAISLWPGAAATSAPEHEVFVRDWTWTQEYVPTEAELAAEAQAAAEQAAAEAAAEKAAAEQAGAEAATEQTAAEQATAEQAAADKAATQAAAEKAAADKAAAEQAAAEQAAADEAAAKQAAADKAAAEKVAAEKAAADKAAADKAAKAQAKAQKAQERADKAAAKAAKAQAKADAAAARAKKAQERADAAAAKAAAKKATK